MDQDRRKTGLLRHFRATFRWVAASAIVAGTLALSAPLQDADAAAGDRALNLYNVHTQQTAVIVFKRGGRYDADGLKQLNYFLRDWRKDQPTNMDPHLFDLIWQVYQESGSRVPIHVVCGFRSPATNAMLRSRSRMVAEHSQHMLGKAMDFFIPDVPLPKLRAIGLRMQVGGVGFYPTSGSPFVHMDTGSVRHWPRMTREQLVRIFPDGKTLHIPSDGRPLPGYEQALAAYKARKASGGDIVMASASSGGKRSWLARLTGRNDDQDNALPNVKAADAAALAADGDAPARVAKPAPAPQDADNADDDSEDTVVAMAPVPRPSPIRHGADAADDAADAVVADAALPPLPRTSPVARPMVALASAAGGVSGHAVAEQLAALNAAPRGAHGAQTAADAIADAVGDPRGDATAMLAYAPSEDGTPHIDAATGAIVAGRQAAHRSSGDGDWRDPLARLTQVGYDSGTIELVMRAGSTRQKGYAEMAMPHPFAMPELFIAPERSIQLGFGRIAYEGLRTDRFAGPLVRPLGTMQFADNESFAQTAYLKR